MNSKSQINLTRIAILFSSLVVFGMLLNLGRIHMALAAFSYGLLNLGLTYRRTNRVTHARFMTLGILIDFSLVLILQIQRSAIQKALAFDMQYIQQLHILSSTLATLGYFPVLYYGRKLLVGANDKETQFDLRKKHIKIASFTFFFRTIGFITMFSLLDKN